MTSPDAPQESRRETRLLLAIIVVSLGALLLLARFRFPAEAEPQPADPAPAPLERLAARAAFDELASTMADFERRIATRIAILQVSPDRASGGYIVAPRVTPDRAIAVLAGDERISLDAASTLVTRDLARDLVVVRLPASEDAVVTPRSGPPRSAPRYVAVVEATAQGPTVRPLYVGRTTPFQEPRTSTPLISFSAVQGPVQRGAAMFTLEGAFIGLVTTEGGTLSLIPGDFLRTAAEAAEPSDRPIADLGVRVQPLSSALARASGADRGVMVTYVEPRGPSAKVLRAGDVIQRVDDTAITTPAGFRQVEQTRTPGAEVVMMLVRDRVPQRVTLRAADAMLVVGDAEDHGVNGRHVPGAGTEVISVRTGSAAAAAGLRRGDLIVLAGSHDAPSPAQLSRVFGLLKPGESLLIGIHSGQDHRMVALEKR